MAQGLAGTDAALEARQTAFREVGRSLAFDPENRAAFEALLQLVSAPPGKLPVGARAELEAADSRRTRTGARTAAWSYLTFFVYLPIFWWMGIRSPPLLALFYGLVLAAAGASWLVGRLKAPRPAWALGPFLISVLMVASLTFILGPFMLLPAFAAINTLVTVTGAAPRYRVTVLALGVVGTLLPVMALLLGWTGSQLSFSGAGLTLVPQMVALEATPTLTLLALSTVASVLFAGLAVLRMGHEVRVAEERRAEVRIRHVVVEEVDVDDVPRLLVVLREVVPP
mgnify:CR=1 FL=1